MHPILERERAAGFPSFVGATVSGTVPLRESVIHEAVAAFQAGKTHRCQIRAIRILSANRIAIDGTVKIVIPIKLTLTAHLASQTSVAAGERLIIDLEGLVGAVSPFLKNLAQKLPPGILLGNRVVIVDIRKLLEDNGKGEFVPLIRTIGFATEPGLLSVSFLLQNAQPQSLLEAKA